MQFSDPTNKNGLIQLIEKTFHFGDAKISGNAAELSYWTTLINNWLSIVNIWIHKVDNEWTYDDFNNGDFPVEVFDFTDNAQNHGIATNGEKDGLAIIKVEAYDVASAAWYDLDLMLQKDMGDNFWGAAADADKPTKYMLSGGSLITDVPVDTAKSTQYRLTYDQQASLFATDATTKEPGFSKDFHMILVYGPGMDWAGVNRPDVYQLCYNKLFGSGEWEGYKNMLQDSYLNRLQEHKPYIGRKKVSYK